MVRLSSFGALLWAVVVSSVLLSLAASERLRTDNLKPCHSLRSFQLYELSFCTIFIGSVILVFAVLMQMVRRIVIPHAGIDLATAHCQMYACDPPTINPETQQPLNCNVDNSVTVICKVANGINCRGLLNGTRMFHLSKPNACNYHAHLHHSTALLLSIFLGFLGIDRMYLGYYAVGIIKMFSLGGLFVLWLIDVVLIVLQLLEPADGSGYIINYYGPRVTPLRFDEATNYSVYTCIDCL